MSIAPYLRVVGRGAKGARSLDEPQAHDLMSRLLDGEVDQLQTGAFVLAMRIKGESVAELSGFLRAVHERCPAFDGPRPGVLLPSYNGARRLPNLTPLLALLLAREGVPVLVHGPRREPGRVSSAEVFEALGLAVCEDLEACREAWAQDQPAFIAIDALCPPLARLLALRQRIGLRNSGHTLAKLLAPPAQARWLRVVNYTHPEYAELLAGFLPHIRADAMLLRGTEGEPVADARRSPKLQVFVAGRARDELGLDAQAGVLGEVPELPREHDAASTAAYIRELLAGERPVPPAIALQVDCARRALAAMAAHAPAAG